MHHPMDRRFSGSGPRRNLLDSGSYRSIRMNLLRVRCISGKAWDTNYLKVFDLKLKSVQAVSSYDKI
jgi:hypothetical protein